MSFTSLGRSVFGKTVPEVLDTAQGRYSRQRAQFFPIWTDLGWWMTFLFFSTINTMKAVRKTQTFRAVIRARFATNWTISSEQIVIKREILYSKLKKEVSPKDFYFCNNIGHSKVFQTNLKHFLAITTQQARIPPTKSGPDGKMLLAPRTNQIAGFVEFHLLTHWEKNKVSLSSLALMYYSLKWPGSIENSTGKRKKTCTLFCCSKTLVLVFLKT